jgi:hypothetical protein
MGVAISGMPNNALHQTILPQRSEGKMVDELCR